MKSQELRNIFSACNQLLYVITEDLTNVGFCVLAEELDYVHQDLLHCAKLAGSYDNITVIVVFLTPPIEIASRPLNAHPLLTCPTPNEILNNMESNNPFLSNVNGQFDVNAAFVKQQQKLDADLQHENGTDLDLDDNRRLIYGTSSSNGKHVGDVDGNDDYDYGDLGPETDVDAVDDVPDVRAPLDRLSRELFPDKKPGQIASEGDNNVVEDDDEDEDEDEDDEDDFSRDNANVQRAYDAHVMDNRIQGQSDEDVYKGVDDNVARDNDDDVPQPPPRGVVDSDVHVAQLDAPVVDDNESPPSPPRAASKCNLPSARTRLCVALVYGYAYHAVSSLFVSLANYISSSFGAHVLGLRRK